MVRNHQFLLCGLHRDRKRIWISPSPNDRSMWSKPPGFATGCVTEPNPCCILPTCPHDLYKARVAHQGPERTGGNGTQWTASVPRGLNQDSNDESTTLRTTRKHD